MTRSSRQVRTALMCGAVAVLTGCGSSAPSAGPSTTHGSFETVGVHLVMAGGPPPGTPRRVVGWIQVSRADGTVVATVKTTGDGAATVNLPAGTYTFRGREGDAGEFWCQASDPVTVRSMPGALLIEAEVVCSVP